MPPSGAAGDAPTERAAGRTTISWFDIEDPDGNEMRWYRVLTSETQVTGEGQQP